MSVFRAASGPTPAGDAIDVFTCTNSDGLALQLMNYGATVTSMSARDRSGEPAVVTLGFSTPAGYLQRHPYFGSTIGRFANRIAGARFTLDDVAYRLAANDGPHHLHGGNEGLDRVLWQSEPFQSDGERGVRFTYLSRHGEEGYPGNLSVEAVYALTDENELRMEFTATADAPTPVNIANHTYWNLAGQGTILDHVVEIEADHYLPVDAAQIPTGDIAAVAGTPMDFTAPKALGRDLEAIPGERVGYDHCFVLRHRSGVARAARLVDPASGRVMEVFTSQPGLQLYTGNNLSGFEPHGGFGRFAGVCVETQHFPDSPNQPQFPSTILAPGERYTQVTMHRFSSA